MWDSTQAMNSGQGEAAMWDCTRAMLGDSRYSLAGGSSFDLSEWDCRIGRMEAETSVPCCRYQNPSSQHLVLYPSPHLQCYGGHCAPQFVGV